MGNFVVFTAVGASISTSMAGTYTTRGGYAVDVAAV
jgi:hypothetical protein